jgi:hypothetical protein
VKEREREKPRLEYLSAKLIAKKIPGLGLKSSARAKDRRPINGQGKGVPS